VPALGLPALRRDPMPVPLGREEPPAVSRGLLALLRRCNPSGGSLLVLPFRFRVAAARALRFLGHLPLWAFALNSRGSEFGQSLTAPHLRQTPRLVGPFGSEIIQW